MHINRSSKQALSPESLIIEQPWPLKAKASWRCVATSGSQGLSWCLPALEAAQGAKGDHLSPTCEQVQPQQPQEPVRTD